MGTFVRNLPTETRDTKLEQQCSFVINVAGFLRNNKIRILLVTVPVLRKGV